RGPKEWPSGGARRGWRVAGLAFHIVRRRQLAAVVDPDVRRQRLKAVAQSALVALRAGTVELPGRFNVAADAGALRMDTAMPVHADAASQRNATRGGSAFRAAHGHAVRIQFDGQFGGHDATQRRVGLGPVERYPEAGAAGAAGQTGMLHDADAT